MASYSSLKCARPLKTPGSMADSELATISLQEKPCQHVCLGRWKWLNSQSIQGNKPMEGS